MNARESIGRRLYDTVTGKWAFLWFFVLFLFSIFAFGFLYSWMPKSHGIEPEGSVNFWSDVFHGMYFSVVTITSLGYGDLRPQGVSRLFAGIQVIWGLTLIGLMIASLTSKRVSHFVASLYASDVQKKLEKLLLGFQYR